MNKEFLDDQILSNLEPITIGQIQQLAEHYFNDNDYDTKALEKFVETELYRINNQYFWLDSVDKLCYALISDDYVSNLIN